MQGVFRSIHHFKIPVMLGLLISSAMVSMPHLSKRESLARINASEDSVQTSRKRLDEEYGQLPLSFEINQGQTDEHVKFMARGTGYGLFLTVSEAVLSLRRVGSEEPNSKPPVSPSDSDDSQSAVLRMRLKGARSEPQVTGDAELSGRVNYLIGDDPKTWHTNIPTYAKVKYRDIYDGIDMVYYGNQRHLEYDFLVAPFADPRRIKLNFKGADRLEIDGSGDLVLHAAGRRLRQRKPISYQDYDGERREVLSRYTLSGKDEVGFQIGQYDPSRPLVIDPVLIYSTFLGGSSEEIGQAIAVDAAGNAYVTGYTVSTDFPTANALQSNKHTATDAFVTKLNQGGTAFIYSTYLGGNSGESGYGIAVDTDGNAYVTGDTASTDFPKVNPIQTGTNFWDMFVLKLNPAGSALIYSTTLGGSNYDRGTSIAIDSVGNAYTTGYTISNNFPTLNPIQPLYGDGGGAGGDAFVTKINAAGTALVFSTYLGGNVDDAGNGIAVDPAGNVYVAGKTSSENFPLANPFSSFRHGPEDGFVTKVNAVGTALIYSTYLGGSSTIAGEGNANDAALAVTADADGNAYVTGWTDATNFPTTPGTFQQTAPPVGYAVKDVFVTKFNPAGTGLIFSTYLGGSEDEMGHGIALDSSRNVYVTGWTESNNFPVLDAFQPYKRGTKSTASQRGTADAFLTKLNSTGTALVNSTFFGGSLSDQGLGIAVDSAGSPYITGFTDGNGCPDFSGICEGFPTYRAVQPEPGGDKDGFIAKFAAERGYNITGRVIDHTGNGLHSVTVTVTGPQPRTVLTDAGGNFATGSLEAGGNYTITATKRGFTLSPQSQVITNLRGDMESVNFYATRLFYTISGHLADSNGASMAGVRMTLTGYRKAVMYTDAGGNYAFKNLPAGPFFPNDFDEYESITYSVQPFDGVHTFTPGVGDFYGLESDQTANFNANPLDPNDYSISGQVTETTGIGISGVTVTLGGEQAGTTQTSSTGSYSFTNLPRYGKYQITARKSLMTFDPPNYTLVTLNPGDTVNFTRTLVPRANSLPASQIIVPHNNATFPEHSYVTIQVDASDPDGTISKVEFYADGAKIGEAAFSLLPFHTYNFTWNNVTAGNHNLTAIATDNDGATITSSIVQIKVGDSYKPTVDLTLPLAGSTFTSPAAIPIRADALGPSGSSNDIARVEFFAGSQLINTDLEYPYIISWDNVPTGTYTLTARATDTGGASNTSSPLTVVVLTPTEQQSTSLSGRVGMSDGSGLAGVTISLSGSQTGTTVTDASGSYSFQNLTAQGNYTVTPAKSGFTFNVQNRSFNNLVGKQTANFTGIPTGTPHRKNMASDFDGDGKTDLAVWRPNTGVWHIVNSSNGSNLAQQWGLGSFNDQLIPGDYDGDGKTDIAVFRPGDGKWYILQSSTNNMRVNQWGLSTDRPVPGDYDGDGKTDVAVWRPSEGRWYILHSSTNMWSVQQWGLSTDRPVPGDYDGDGKTDVAVWRPGNGTWYVLQSSDGVLKAMQWGLSTDLPVGGDYDGDDKTDVAVLRSTQTGSVWYVFQSTTNSMNAQVWGLSDDKPVPGDYDLDGKTDLAVFRPGNGVWYVRQSTDGVLLAPVWGLSGDVPVPAAYLY